MSRLSGRASSARGIAALVIVLLLVSLLTFAASPARAGTLTLAAYRAALQEAVGELRSDPTSAPQVATRLRGIEQVALDDGSITRPDLDWLLRDLESQPPETTRAIAGLEALLSMLAVDGDDQGRVAIDSLQRVLARDEFQDKAETDTLGDLFARFQIYILQTVVEALSPAFRLIGALLRPLGPAAPFIGIALIVGLGVWVVRSLRRTVGRAVVQLRPGPAGQTMTGEEARIEAERLAQSGSFRLAIRALYLAVLLRLDERSLIRFDRALTNREVLSTASGRGDSVLAERLAPLVERFDRYWYGGVPCTAQDYAEFAQLARRAWEAP